MTGKLLRLDYMNVVIAFALLQQIFRPSASSVRLSMCQDTALR